MRAIPVLLGAGAVGIGLLLWFGSSPGRPAAPLQDAPVHRQDPTGSSVAADDEPSLEDETSDGQALPRPDDAEPLVPRVLPPDAALEDVRDALAADDADALAEAFASIGRLAAQSPQSLAALQRQIERTDDARVRGVALVATGRVSSPSVVRFAAMRLMEPKRREAGDVVGAFATLVLAPEANGDPVALTQLGPLSVPVGAVSSEEVSTRAITFFLDHTAQAGDEIPDLVELWARSIAAHPRLAELLVVDGRRRAYVAALPDAVWQRLRREALRHDLSDDAKRAYAE